MLDEIGTSEEAQALKEQIKSHIGKTLQGEETKALLQKALQFIETRTATQETRLEAMSTDKLMAVIEAKTNESKIVANSSVLAKQVDQFAAEQFGVAISALDPVQVLEQAQDLLPSVTESASNILKEYKKYFESSGNGAALLAKAKTYVDAAEAGDLTGKITTAMSQFDVEVSVTNHLIDASVADFYYSD